MTPRNVLMLVALALVGVVLAGQVRRLLADPTVWPPDDFVEYWAAARLTLNGENPFDEARLLELQRAAGRATDEAVMMWNPPWALPAVLALGLMPAREAQVLWLLVHLAVTWFCADRLWLLCGGARARRWVGWALAFAFLPTAFALSSGQIGPFLLLGAVLFLEAARRWDRDRRWEYAAGAATVLLAIKPHLAYLVWAGLAVDAVARGRWRVLVGGALTGLACAVLPMAFNPQVWHQYADAMGNRPPAQWASPTLGTLLRMALGEELFRLQFAPVALGLAWFAWFRWHARANWNWCDRLPLVLLVSFVTTPYGAWPFDMVLLLPAAFAMVAGAFDPTPDPSPGRGGEQELRDSVHHDGAQVVTRACPPSPPRGGGRGVGLGSSRPVLIGLALVNVGCLLMNLFQTGSFWFVWVSPAVLALYAVHMTRTPIEQGADAPRSPRAVPA